MSKTIHYLLVFDHERNELIVEREFRKASDGLAAYAEYEQAYDQNNRVEIVLIGSDSIETIRQTHANYFEPVGTSRYFEGIGV